MCESNYWRQKQRPKRYTPANPFQKLMKHLVREAIFAAWQKQEKLENQQKHMQKMWKKRGARNVSPSGIKQSIWRGDKLEENGANVDWG